MNPVEVIWKAITKSADLAVKSENDAFASNGIKVQC